MYIHMYIHTPIKSAVKATHHRKLKNKNNTVCMYVRRRSTCLESTVKSITVKYWKWKVLCIVELRFNMSNAKPHGESLSRNKLIPVESRPWKGPCKPRRRLRWEHLQRYCWADPRACWPRPPIAASPPQVHLSNQLRSESPLTSSISCTAYTYQ
jgi:hypothetical protein